MNAHRLAALSGLTKRRAARLLASLETADVDPLAKRWLLSRTGVDFWPPSYRALVAKTMHADVMRVFGSDRRAGRWPKCISFSGRVDGHGSYTDRDGGCSFCGEKL